MCAYNEPSFYTIRVLSGGRGERGDMPPPPTQNCLHCTCRYSKNRTFHHVSLKYYPQMEAVRCACMYVNTHTTTVCLYCVCTHVLYSSTLSLHPRCTLTVSGQWQSSHEADVSRHLRQRPAPVQANLHPSHRRTVEL